MAKELYYFAADGNYGNANGLVIVDTSDWNDDDWAIVEYQTPEWQRPTKAAEITAVKNG
jgi:hypothetical protein